MIQTKIYVDEEGIEHKDLIVHYSDAGLPIREIGTFKIYEDGIAIDPIDSGREYEEVIDEEPIDEDEEEELQDTGNQLLGE